MERILLLEGSKIKTIEDFHSEVKQLLDFPDYYGNNLNALWDCLTGSIETPLTLIWKDFAASKVNTGDFAESARDVFIDAQQETNGFEFRWV